MNGELSLVQPLLGLVFVFLAMFGAFWIVRKLQDKKNIFGGKSIHIIEAASVGTRERIVIASVEGKRLVLGVTAQSINLLKELEQAEGETSTSSITQPEKESFKTQLTQSLSSVLPQRGKQ
jgi:flagellar protein FliO/FliZ